MTASTGGEAAGPGAPGLHVAMVAPPWFEVPPRGYGGIEQVVAALVDQLVERGHEVTLLGSGQHRTSAQHFVQLFPAPPTRLLGDPLPEVVAAAAVARALAEHPVDVVHDHSLAGPLLARGRDVPTVVTAHGPMTGLYADYYAHLGTGVDLVSISHAQRTLAPSLNWRATVHNAVDVSSYRFRKEKDDYLLWLGRLSPDKGAHVAVAAARAHGMRLVLAGKINEASEKEYFESVVAPELGRDAEYVGEADDTLKRELFAGARAFLFPIHWEEPFGMVMVEAMASGTPVLAIGRGSVPEVVDHGVSGLVVRDDDEFVAAVPAVLELDPADCRAVAQARFDLPVMGAGYERVYRRVVGHGHRRDTLSATG